MRARVVSTSRSQDAGELAPREQIPLIMPRAIVELGNDHTLAILTNQEAFTAAMTVVLATVDAFSLDGVVLEVRGQSADPMAASPLTPWRTVR